MLHQFLNIDRILGLDPAGFHQRLPFPWFNVDRLLTDEGFAALYRDFPSLDQFERHDGLQRVYGQRPHNRYYLAYEQSIYHSKEQSTEPGGVISHSDLKPAWQLFVDELSNSPVYRRFIQTLLGVTEYSWRMAWHVGVKDSEVSPHRDSATKVGTHIFYFNTVDDWDPAWGGETLVLGGKLTDRMNPDFTDFATIENSTIVDNRSFLFRNTANAWHGVRSLVCPEGKHRRLFNFIIETPNSEAEIPKRGLLTRMAARVGLRRARTSVTRTQT